MRIFPGHSSWHGGVTPIMGHLFGSMLTPTKWAVFRIAQNDAIAGHVTRLKFFLDRLKCCDPQKYLESFWARNHHHRHREPPKGLTFDNYNKMAYKPSVENASLAQHYETFLAKLSI